MSPEGQGYLDTLEEAKSAVERVWWDWVARHGLRDDPLPRVLAPFNRAGPF
jgi:uncharacterized protein YfaT (DUF1175 family)